MDIRRKLKKCANSFRGIYTSSLYNITKKNYSFVHNIPNYYKYLNNIIAVNFTDVYW